MMCVAVLAGELSCPFVGREIRGFGRSSRARRDGTGQMGALVSH